MIADADVFANHLVVVVQCRAFDFDAADADGFEPGNGSERAGATDLNDDVFNDGGNFMAIAQRGERESSPSFCCWRKELTFTTMPSMS